MEGSLHLFLWVHVGNWKIIYGKLHTLYECTWRELKFSSAILLFPTDFSREKGSLEGHWIRFLNYSCFFLISVGISVLFTYSTPKCQPTMNECPNVSSRYVFQAQSQNWVHRLQLSLSLSCSIVKSRYTQRDGVNGVPFLSRLKAVRSLSPGFGWSERVSAMQ